MQHGFGARIFKSVPHVQHTYLFICEGRHRIVLKRSFTNTKQQREIDGNASTQQQIFILCRLLQLCSSESSCSVLHQRGKIRKKLDNHKCHTTANFYFQATFFLVVVIKNLPDNRKVWKQKEAFEVLIFAAHFNKWQSTRQRLWLLRKPRKCAWILTLFSWFAS